MASVDYFLKLDGIDGESSDSKHKNEVDLESWNWGESQVGSHGGAGGGGGAGKVSMQDFHFTTRTNKASPKLMLACATGEHIKKAVLVCRKAGKEQQEYLKITMSDCLVSSYQLGGSQGDVLPMDQVALNFAKIEFEYLPQKSDGSLDSKVVVGYDLKANKKV